MVLELEERIFLQEKGWRPDLNLVNTTVEDYSVIIRWRTGGEIFSPLPPCSMLVFICKAGIALLSSGRMGNRFLDFY